jgi:glycolate oxidase iron-sulfur subunit
MTDGPMDGPAPANFPDRGPRTGGWLEDLLACVHCGFCLPVCPTYEVLGEENDSPRGRIYLMRALAEGRIGVEDAFSSHVNRCLGCRACETACPAGVRYGSLLEKARELMLSESTGDRFPDFVLGALTGRRTSRLAYWLARIARKIRLAEFGARFAPGRTGLASGMIAATGRSAGRTGSAGSVPLADPQGSGSSETYALLEGCVMSGLYSHVHHATRRTLQRRGHAERPAPGQECCGALHAHAGRLEAARALARRNIEAFEKSGARIIVTDSAGCGAAIRDYPEWLRAEPDWRRRADALAERVRDISELVTGSADPVPPAGNGPRVAYDAPCHLLHAQGIRDAPLEALAASGYDVDPLPSWERCCGGAGLYNLQQPELSDRILERKVEEVRGGGYDVVATGNPGCMMFLGAGLKRAGLDVNVVHPVELVDQADRNAERRAEYRVTRR